jgi:hypothetical protein
MVSAQLRLVLGDAPILRLEFWAFLVALPLRLPLILTYLR